MTTTKSLILKKEQKLDFNHTPIQLYILFMVYISEDKIEFDTSKNKKL